MRYGSLILAAVLLTSGAARAAFCCPFEYVISNYTSKVAYITLTRKMSGHAVATVGRWVSPGRRVVVKMPDYAYYDLKAEFKANGEGSSTIATATYRVYLEKGSADKLVEEHGHYSWEPGH